ncbi:phytanoyl-CoA dioxygenase family protein [unidentified bacterial endosymbiont]|uniref:phytanoyl-CoA dioxygenase family protein n=1 Tax=unidentified bacterial endosymbiont TaxID=2355 RepID=UPI0020A2136F|nr:phytanoyl-CoA dioxygenase family protein [unidentified bacterial endosymbiont]
MDENRVGLPLGSQQLERWHRDGFLILENVLSPQEIVDLLGEVGTVISQHNNVSSHNTSQFHGKKYYNIHNPFDYTEGLDYLLDHPKTFNVVTYLMGPYIRAMSCHLFVRHPCRDGSTNLQKFHTDSGPALQRILPTRENLPLQLKFQFFLTNVKEDNASNFIAIPGSHLRRVEEHNPYCLISEANQYLEKGQLPPGAVQLKLKAGDVLIHALTLWHAVAPNHSNQSRLSISIRYGQMWFRDYYFAAAPHIMARMTPRQRRLLGDFNGETRGDLVYRPPEDQVSLMLGEKARAFGW